MKYLSTAIVFVLMFASCAFAQDLMQAVTAPNMVFEQGYIQVIGESEAGQSRYKALRAAKVVAQRDMLEVVEGLQLAGASSVNDGMLQVDAIRNSVQGSLKGAVVVAEEYVKEEGYARVVLRLGLRGQNSLYQSLAPVLQQPPSQLNISHVPAFQPQQAAPAPAPAQIYDGLIVIVEGTGFKPAMANRILAESQEVLFEPSRVAPQMLIERGCGGYTTTEAKAKALLVTWGSKNPLIIRSLRAQKGTEAVISVEDATNVYKQDEKSNILSEAKVVFVL